jgi:hypothetical protein
MVARVPVLIFGLKWISDDSSEILKEQANPSEQLP